MSSEIIETTPIYGIMAEFETPHDLVEAATTARNAGYRKMDAFSPYPIEDLEEPLELHDNRVSLATLFAGLCGGFSAFGFLSWVNTISYPLNIAGRPMISAPMFIPITFEFTVLCAGLTAAFSMILMNGLPMPYHPVFNVPRFVRASQDGFFLCIEAKDPLFDRQKTGEFMETLGALEVNEVAN